MRHEKSLMMGGLLIASLFGGVIANLLGGHVEAQGPSVVTATQLNLVDEHGLLRSTLGTADGVGTPVLTFFDADGRERAVFGIERDGEPVMRLLDLGGQDQLNTRLVGEDAYLVVGDDRQRHVLVSSVAGTPIIGLADGADRRAQLHLGSNGEPSVVLLGQDGQRSAAITVDPTDTPLVTLYDEGRARLTFGVVQGAVVVNFSDGSRTRLVMGVAESGQPSVTFLDENGEVVDQVP